MIKAIIFDCYGVLTTDGWLAFKDKYLLHDSKKRDEASELNRQSDAGLITHQEFLENVASLSGVSIRKTAMIMDTHVRNDQLFSYIENNLKARYKIGLLSNAADDYTSSLFTLEQNQLFDEKVFSFELGVVKPDSLMYETIAAKLGMTPEECLFVDDRLPFVEGAKAVGMEAIVYKDISITTKEIEKILRSFHA